MDDFLFNFARIGSGVLFVINVVSYSALALLILVVGIRDRKKIRWVSKRSSATQHPVTFIRINPADAGVAVLALVKAQGLREGFWQLSGLAGPKAAATTSEINPTALVPITAMGLQRVDSLENPGITIDAAVVNPSG
jgi:hypothetical protein